MSLPRGGGAIRGIGEKFAANPVTGTGSMSIPIAASPGRSGFGPQLSISYDSGAGNGPFGFGWSLTLPSIARKTDKGLPLYSDSEQSDVFILSGAEDLVPVLESDGTRHRDETGAGGYVVERYRPRIEGLFARIERWTRRADGEVHWRSVSRDNILTLYGTGAGSRVADPLDPRRVFRWLISETRDDKGNAILYEYKREDGAGVDVAASCERNRGDRNDPRRTASLYLKRILYGNRTPLLDSAGRRPTFLADLPATQMPSDGWMFELVLDYGEHDAVAPAPGDNGSWGYRPDPFSSYRSGFEIRTTRLCRRALRFHHIPDPASGGAGYDGLVRSTAFSYSHDLVPGSARNPVYTFLRAVTQSGHRRKSEGGYESRSLPPVEFEYSEPEVRDSVETVDPQSVENLPVGVDGAGYSWVDLHGEGLAGILSEQGGAFFYKRNLSPLGGQDAVFGPTRCVAEMPNVSLAAGAARFMDLAGDGQPDLVVLDGPAPGFYEHGEGEGWKPFQSFTSRLTVDMGDPNLKLVDLDGNGRADVLISEGDGWVWHPSLAERGFGEANRVARALDEEKGPRLVFADAGQSIHFADMSGDGLTDLVRIRNGEICYWPNLGYGRFGAKVAMDRAPLFDRPDQFDPRRLRLADVDGSGTTDIVYLHGDEVRLYFNQSGNGWAGPQPLSAAPPVDDATSIELADLLGNGTACLVWSSSRAADAGRPMRYVNLIGARKPHLMVRSVNNLGAETRIDYAPSTKFYLQDERDGRPWIGRLPFPVHVVERVETFDHVSRNRFVARYAYHHGHFDGEEREFRGFGMVEQWDTEELAALTADGTLAAANLQAASHVPPVLTRTWYHTGIYLGRDHVSNFFAGLLDARDTGEYYLEPGDPALGDDDAAALLLPDTLLPPGLTLEEEREACRALKGSMLRQEVYALDGSAREPHPYTVAEQNFTVRREQQRGPNRHGIFLVHPCEALTWHYERNPADPRVQHAMTLEVDGFGNVLKQAAIGYGRRASDLALPADRARQETPLITYSEHGFTDPIDEDTAFPGAYRAPLPCESRTWELTGYSPAQTGARFRPSDFVKTAGGAVTHDFAGEVAYEAVPAGARRRRLIEHLRTLYRADDLGSQSSGGAGALAGLLPLGDSGALALPGETYKLAFTSGLLTSVYRRAGQSLIPQPSAVLGAVGGDGGGYLSGQTLKTDGRFPPADPGGHWWIPSGRTFLSPNSADGAAQELAYARAHFFLPLRFRDPFHSGAASTETLVAYDSHDLLLRETRDAVGNRTSVGLRKSDGTIDAGQPGNDYRVLQPALVTDPNRNRSAVAYDALGLIVGTAVMGKIEDSEGDSLEAFVADLPEATILAHIADPLDDPWAILGTATTRLVYDLFAYSRSAGLTESAPACVYTMARETHHSDLAPNARTRVQHGFSYSDGFGREIQKKIQAEPGPLVEGGQSVSPRWVGSGWTVFNNKGKPVRQYEPFFSAGHGFEFGVAAGVSPILFYDPPGRVVATLHPNHSYEKVLFDPWRQVSWDANDTVLLDPRTDADVQGYVRRHFAALGASGGAAWKTWRTQRSSAALGAQEQAAAVKAAAHAGTPTVAHFDSLGRPFLTFADNGPEPAAPTGPHRLYATRVELDIEGNQRSVRDAIVQAGDALGRIVMRYAYDMLGNRIRQESMEAGARWMLADAAGKPLRSWNSRRHDARIKYDASRRPRGTLSTGADPADPTRTLLTDWIVYGEQHPDAETRNLRGKIFLHLDQPGAATNEFHDFKGNQVSGSRRLSLATLYRAPLDWSTAEANAAAFPTSATQKFDPAALEAAIGVQLESSTYSSNTEYDALNRPVLLTTPHTAAMAPSRLRAAYNEANLLERVDVNLRGAAFAGRLVWTPFVTGIEYDSKGQRRRIDYGNKVSTVYEHDPLTYRLTRLTTRRDATDFPNDCPHPAPTGWPGCQVQDLHYTYDPVGNVTRIEDRAQQAVFFANRRVEPSADYVYDPLSRLIEATGREHLGQGGARLPHGPDDALRARLPQPGDGNAMAAYVESYVYDAVGNLLEMRHGGATPKLPGWTRHYDYAEASLIENGQSGALLKAGNRLSATLIGTSGTPERYRHDAHGNMIRMPHLGGGAATDNMAWDEGDRLRQVDLGGGGKAWYVYDSAGRRVRKVWEKSASLVEERIYFSGFEIYRRRQGGQLLERETLHVMDDKQRIALVETRTIGSSVDDPAPERLIRYQFSNHLGSAGLELDGQGQIISYEEYSPYGSTTYQAVRSVTETPKRYRYTGKERDEESGLYHHGARCLAPWLGRWTSSDPAGLVDGHNLYQYARSRPTVLTDPSGTDSDPRDFQSRSIAISMRQDAKTGSIAYGLSIKLSDTQSKEMQGHLSSGDAGGLISLYKDLITDQGVSKLLRPEEREGLRNQIESFAANAGIGSAPSEKESSDEGFTYRSTGQGIGSIWDTYHRRGYINENKAASGKAVEKILKATAEGNESTAWSTAQKVSGERNARRTATQGKLTPGGRRLSEALEGERSFAEMEKTYSKRLPSSEATGSKGAKPTNNRFEIARRIAVASGDCNRSLLYFTKAARVLGPIAVGYGIGMGIRAYANAPESEKGRVAAREIGSFAGGLVGASIGMSAGVAAGNLLVAIGIAVGPVGWLLLGIAGAFVVGGLLSWGGGEVGEAGYESAQKIMD